MEVVAALIERDGKILICRRPANKARGGLWEFVGGKVEAGESKEQAIIRECKEELCIEVQPKGVFAEVTHQYPDVTVHLTLFSCAICGGQLQLLEHDEMAWAAVDELKNFELCPADSEIVARLCRKKLPEVKITVMRRAEYPDLSQKYENAIEDACTLKVGQTFYSAGQRPDGLCQSAWETLQPFIQRLLSGGGNFFDGWMKDEKSAMLSCNDGFRPVSFYIELLRNGNEK